MIAPESPDVTNPMRYRKMSALAMNRIHLEQLASRMLPRKPAESVRRPTRFLLMCERAANLGSDAAALSDADDVNADSATVTGGCLCGAITWRATAPSSSVHFCHCAMCRRWTGSPFATLAWYPKMAVRWSGADPVAFRSSPIAVRSHCGHCGTPLSLAYDGQDKIALTVGSFDRPQEVTPDHHYGIESRIAWADIGASFPGEATQERW